jgi:hypothetical protein
MIEALLTFMSLGPVGHLIWLSLTIIVATIVIDQLQE